MLVIDARKAMDAGIGTYIRELVPRVCNELQDIKCHLLVSPAASYWANQLLKSSGANLTYTLFNATPFSVSEQILLRCILNKESLFWATSLSHPLFYGGRYVTTVHDVAQLALPRKMAGGFLTKKVSRVYLKSILRDSREIIFDSEFSRLEFIKHVGNPTQKNSVIHLGVDSKWFDIPKGAHEINPAPYFISVSSIRPHKNFAFLLKAFLDIANFIPHNLLIVGEKSGLTDFEPALMRRVSDSGNRVKFLGRINDEELKIWVANAEAMIFPSLYEGFGLPPIEAMAAGCPVISSSSAAIKEVCGNAAVYFNPIELESLISVLSSFSLGDRASRESLIKTGRMKALEYNWDLTAQSTAEVLRRSLVD
jgi:glycosyltransferase involved in cell wall biosynthesis